MAFLKADCIVQVLQTVAAFSIYGNKSFNQLIEKKLRSYTGWWFWRSAAGRVYFFIRGVITGPVQNTLLNAYRSAYRYIGYRVTL